MVCGRSRDKQLIRRLDADRVITGFEQRTFKKLTSTSAPAAVFFYHLLTKPFWMRLPPTDCCPTQAIIWEMFSGDPLDPHSAMIRGLRNSKSIYSESSKPSRIDELRLGSYRVRNTGILTLTAGE